MSERSERVEIGDLFQDLDKRAPTPRVVRVIEGPIGPRDNPRSISNPGQKSYLWEPSVIVENVEHWDEKRIGHRRYIAVRRLLTPHRFKRISR